MAGVEEVEDMTGMTDVTGMEVVTGGMGLVTGTTGKNGIRRRWGGNLRDILFLIANCQNPLFRESVFGNIHDESTTLSLSSVG
jgi:hypothetical protein